MTIAAGVSAQASATGGTTSLTTAAVTSAASGSAFANGLIHSDSTLTATASDSKGNTYSIFGTTLPSGIGDSKLRYCENAVGGASHTFTVALSGAGGFLTFFVLEVTGGALSGIADQVARAEDTTDPYVSGTVTPGQADELLASWAFTDVPSTTYTANNSFTKVQEHAGAGGGEYKGALGYRVVAAIAAYEGSWSLSSGSTTQVWTASFKAAASTAAATPAPTPRLIKTDRLVVTGGGLPQAFAPRKVQVYPSPASFDFPVQNVPPLGQATPEVMRLKPFRAAPFLARVVPMPSTVLTVAAVLSATGDATATFVGAAQDNSVLAAAGDATATFTGASKAAAVLSAAADATATFTGTAKAASVLSAAADATATFTGAALAKGVLAAPGDATATFTGAALDRGVLNAPGDSSLSFVGRADAAAVWNAAADASAAWIGSTGGNALSADGDSSAIFVGAELAAAVLAAAGDSSALWSGAFTVPGGNELGARAPMRGRAKARKPPKQRRPIYRHPEEVEREQRMLEEYLESLETKARPASEEPVRPGESEDAPTRRAEPVAPRLSDVMARLASAQQLALIASAERVANEDRAKAQKEHKRRRAAATAVLMMSH